MTSSPADARPGRAPALPPDERRRSIVRAALPLVRAKGTDVTTREIAEAAGIAEGTIFRVFADKQELLDAVVADAFDVTATIAAIGAVDTALPLRDRLIACVEILAARLASVVDLMIALRMRGPAPHPPRGEEKSPGGQDVMDFKAAQAALLVVIEQLIAPDAARLRVDPARAAGLVRMLTFAGSHHAAHQGAHRGAHQHQEPDGAAHPAFGPALTPAETVDVILYGIARPGAVVPQATP